MKRNKLLYAVVSVLLCATMSASAKSWRINNDETKGAHFVSINAAMSSEDVVAGDTLYLDPGCNIDGGTVYKSVTIIGCGYFRRNSPHKFARITGTLKIAAPNVKIESVSCGTLELGINYNGQNSNGAVIERCATGSISCSSNGADAQNVTVRQCYVSGSVGMGGSKTPGFVFENNIMITSDGQISSVGNNAIIRNNYIRANKYDGAVYINYSNVQVKNNIIINNSGNNSEFGGWADTPSNNNVIAHADPNGNNKSIGFTSVADFEAAVFALIGLNDERYELKSDSPAKGYADDGGDCGPFGGEYPYVPGGMPMSAPYFTKALIGEKATGNEISVTLQINQQEQ